MIVQPIKTEDGSDSLFVPELNEHYHSTKGALQESRHVFIEAGFNQIGKKVISVFEVGLGTGLNALLTLNEALQKNISVHYTSIERYPIAMNIVEKLNYAALIDERLHEAFMLLHTSDWGAETKINETFTFQKVKGDLANWQPDRMFDLIYFDAFGPDKQPEMWSEEIFSNLYQATNHNGILTTYSAKGTVRRALQAVGFSVERIPGPPGKNHMTRAVREV